MMNFDLPFEYRGCHFTCSVHQSGPDAYQPLVLYRYGLMTLEQIALPEDTAPYATAAEAMRHAQQQAVRWTHDRTGSNAGQL